jgi:hypothetical protein
MDRRAFMIAIGSVLVVWLAARAQQAGAVRRIGWLWMEPPETPEEIERRGTGASSPPRMERRTEPACGASLYEWQDRAPQTFRRRIHPAQGRRHRCGRHHRRKSS